MVTLMNQFWVVSDGLRLDDSFASSTNEAPTGEKIALGNSTHLEECSYNFPLSASTARFLSFIIFPKDVTCD